MAGTIILFFIAFLSAYLFHKIAQNLSVGAKSSYEHLYAKCAKLIQTNTKLRAENSGLEKSVEEMVALFDMTKQICKSLDQEKILNYFKEEIGRHVKVGECSLLEPQADLAGLVNFVSLPIKLERKTIGMLVVRDIFEADKDKVNILVQQFSLGMKRALLYQQIQELAITDKLTGVSSRKYCLERLEDELARSKKLKNNFSVLMVDVDHFKEINDQYGHLVGDVILKEIARVIKDNTRQIDLMGRYGGEEFIVVLTETAVDQARYAAERIRSAVQKKSVTAYDEKLTVTISLGISSFPQHADSVASLIDKADKALYKAKESGRNKAVVF